MISNESGGNNTFNFNSNAGYSLSNTFTRIKTSEKNQKFNFCITVPRNINDKRIALAVITHCRQILKLLNNVSLTPYCK